MRGLQSVTREKLVVEAVPRYFLYRYYTLADI